MSVAEVPCTAGVSDRQQRAEIGLGEQCLGLVQPRQRGADRRPELPDARQDVPGKGLGRAERGLQRAERRVAARSVAGRSAIVCSRSDWRLARVPVTASSAETSSPRWLPLAASAVNTFEGPGHPRPRGRGAARRAGPSSTIAEARNAAAGVVERAVERLGGGQAPLRRAGRRVGPRPTASRPARRRSHAGTVCRLARELEVQAPTGSGPAAPARSCAPRAACRRSAGPGRRGSPAARRRRSCPPETGAGGCRRWRWSGPGSPCLSIVIVTTAAGEEPPTRLIAVTLPTSTPATRDGVNRGAAGFGR